MTDEHDRNEEQPVKHPEFTKFRDERLKNPAVRAAYEEAKARRDADENDVPFVAVGNGETPPWGNDRDCPECGEPDLPLLDSKPPGLTYIKHCDKAWLRGPIRVTFPPGKSTDKEGR